MPTIQKTLQILEFIRAYSQEHYQAPPLRLIGEEFAMSSTASVQHHVDEMKRRGWIKRAHYSRTIEILKPEQKKAA